MAADQGDEGEGLNGGQAAERVGTVLADLDRSIRGLSDASAASASRAIAASRSSRTGTW
jgi:hypothetical protein